MTAPLLSIAGAVFRASRYRNDVLIGVAFVCSGVAFYTFAVRPATSALLLNGFRGSPIAPGSPITPAPPSSLPADSSISSQPHESFANSSLSMWREFPVYCPINEPATTQGPVNEHLLQNWLALIQAEEKEGPSNKEEAELGGAKLAEALSVASEASLQVHAGRDGGGTVSTTSTDQREGSCEGRRVFVYDLPPEFNKGLLDDCKNLRKNANLCPRLVDSGMGLLDFQMDNIYSAELGLPEPEGVWYRTHMFMLEVYFHARVLRHRCRTLEPRHADAFFIPYYAGLDAARRSDFGLSKVEGYQRLFSWLREQESWDRRGGLDHMILLGRIALDFMKSSNMSFGNQMLRLTRDLELVTKFSLEPQCPSKVDGVCQATDPSRVGVPYPTGFHPKRAEQLEQLRRWARGSEEFHVSHIAALAAARRKLQAVRDTVTDQCQARPGECALLDCADRKEWTQEGSDGGAKLTVRSPCLDPWRLLGSFHSSEFCLQPPGGSATRKSFFDGILTGCIPVVFSEHAAHTQYTYHLPRDWCKYSVFVEGETLASMHANGTALNVIDFLKLMDKRTVQALREGVLELIPTISYFHPDHNITGIADAFDVSIDAHFQRVAAVEAGT